jgi:hypothetical protein
MSGDDDGAVESGADVLASLFTVDDARGGTGEDAKRVSVRAGGFTRHRARLEARRSETTTTAAAAAAAAARRGGFVGDADGTSASACAERYVPKWCKGGGGGGGKDGKDGEEEPSAEDAGGSKKVKKSDAAMSVVTTHDLGRGRRCVVQAMSDCEAGGDPVRSRWDVEADAERRFGADGGLDLDEDYKAFHATVNAHTLTKEVELELGSVHREFGMEFRQSVKGRLDRGLVAATRATSASFSFGTPTKQYDAFRLLHGVKPTEAKTETAAETTKTTTTKTEKKVATPPKRTNSAKAQYAYNFEKASARAVVTANSKPPSSNPDESSHPLRDVIDVKFRATSDIVKSHAARLAVRAKLSPTTRAQIVARSKSDKAGLAHGLDLELGRDFNTASTKLKTTVSFSIPLTKYALKLTADGASSSSHSLRLSSREVIAETRLRRGRRVEIRLGARKSFLTAAPSAFSKPNVGSPTKRPSSNAIEAFIAIGFSSSFHPRCD